MYYTSSIFLRFGSFLERIIESDSQWNLLKSQIQLLTVHLGAILNVHCKIVLMSAIEEKKTISREKTLNIVGSGLGSLCLRKKNTTIDERSDHLNIFLQRSVKAR
jgi:hypothetical protein